jgi:hypothetical protein
MEYDHLTGQLQLQGKIKALLLPSTGKAKAPPSRAASGASR